MEKPTRINDDLAVAGQPGKQDIQRLAALGYRSLINNRPGGEEAGQLPPDEEAAEAAQQGLGYIHIPVTASTLSRAEVDAFRQALEQAPKPVLAHCKSGARSYLLWALGQVLYEGRDPNQLVQEAAALGYPLQSLPALAYKLKA